ncbi:MAG: hypothetical protein DMG32_09385 [Acidobacteria bacterium]|nr:MAG: hypothetical protein DMG32_09385 [Acidobacteriota bacterium]
MTAQRLRRKHSSPRLGVIFAALASLACAGLIFLLPYLEAGGLEPAANDPQTNRSGQAPSLKGLPPTDLTEDQAIVHALNRLGYGPRPGDLQRVKEMGLAKWLDRQLHPESLNDSSLQTRLSRFPTLSMSSEALLERFPRPQVAARREGVSPQEYRKEQQEKLQAAREAADNRQGADSQQEQMPDQISGQPHGDSRRGESGQPARNAQQNASDGSPQSSSPQTMAPDELAEILLPGAKNLANQSRPGNPAGNTPGNAQMNFEQIQTPQRVIAELAMAKMDRAVYSEKQVYEQMVDFWFNHFNVFAGKGADRWLLTSYERDTIRPHAMGKFRDLLAATAKSPAMLFYLDNWQSVDPKAWARLQQEQARRQAYRARLGGPFGAPRPFPRPPANPNQAKKQERGLNENYGRELMELHTLGVDGGYSQQDVIEVARCFTGWTIRQPQRDPQFWFNERLHDPNPKMVLGHKINAGGMRDGEEVLDLLARDPHTAHHLSLEIARHFVSDNPPDALVDRMAQTYESTDGDIRAVLHTMIYSPEFWSREAYRAKIKTPFEFVASAARAVGAESDVPLALVQWTGRIGEPLYQCQPPTGYSDKAEAWVSTGALLNRLNYSLTLAGNRLPGVGTDIRELLGGDAAGQPGAVLDQAIAVLLSGEASPQTRETLEKQMSDPRVLQASLDDPITQVNEGMIAGLVLGAPEFQRR